MLPQKATNSVILLDKWELPASTFYYKIAVEARAPWQLEARRRTKLNGRKWGPKAKKWRLAHGDNKTTSYHTYHTLTKPKSATVYVPCRSMQRVEGKRTASWLFTITEHHLQEREILFRRLKSNATHCFQKGDGRQRSWCEPSGFLDFQGQTHTASGKFLMFIHINLKGALRTNFRGSKHFPSNFLSLILLAPPYKPPDHAVHPAEWCHPGSSVLRRPPQMLALIYLWLKRQKYMSEQCRKISGSDGYESWFHILLWGLIFNHATMNTVQRATISQPHNAHDSLLKGNISLTEFVWHLFPYLQMNETSIHSIFQMRIVAADTESTPMSTRCAEHLWNLCHFSPSLLFLPQFSHLTSSPYFCKISLTGLSVSSLFPPCSQSEIPEIKSNQVHCLAPKPFHEIPHFCCFKIDSVKNLLHSKVYDAI